MHRPRIRETTALGVAFLAGLAVGVWKDTNEIKQLWSCDAAFTPDMEEGRRKKLLRGWHRAVQRSFQWSEPEDEELDETK